MIKDLLPDMEFMRQEYVLIQAWKKSSEYIRYHSWFADTLELDWITADLPDFIDGLSSALASPETWESDPLRLVPAPKSQKWHVTLGRWKPVELIDEDRLRPLAHVSVRDQVVATALMLCLANRVETRQGDPTISYKDPESRRYIYSYGNRLFCDSDESGRLYHRWGTHKLYRRFYKDYRSFVKRPSYVAEEVSKSCEGRVFVLNLDLKQYYDRVRPPDLKDALLTFKQEGDDPVFFDFCKRVLNWVWNKVDEADVTSYCDRAGIGDFSRVALPQGLVSAGFFANTILIPFDEALGAKFDEELVHGVYLHDACRYVDDLRLVVSTETKDPDDVVKSVEAYIANILNGISTELLLSEKKTEIIEFNSSQRLLVRQSSRLDRIQEAVSGGFDSIAGAEILDSVQGLIRTQDALLEDGLESGWKLSPIPDVRSDSVARFSAARYRTVYRSMRPMLDDDGSKLPEDKPVKNGDFIAPQRRRSKVELDHDARVFAFYLIETWITDPSNVRLLRIGLDICPDVEVLKSILGLLVPMCIGNEQNEVPRKVACYCLGEVLRVGATETGFVNDLECLPAGTDLNLYREELSRVADTIVNETHTEPPWYLLQQALLFLTAFSPNTVREFPSFGNGVPSLYHKLHLFQMGRFDQSTDSEFAIFTILIYRAFPHLVRYLKFQPHTMTAAQKAQLALREPSLAVEFAREDVRFASDLPLFLQEALCIGVYRENQSRKTLADIVLNEERNLLRNELSLLQFAEMFLKRLQEQDTETMTGISPSRVELGLNKRAGSSPVEEVRFLVDQSTGSSFLYDPPSWCPDKIHWRFHLGYLLRFILTRREDFTVYIPSNPGNNEIDRPYKPLRSHWYQRIYGMFNGQQAFGDDWLPISDWMEHFLLALFHWPGCRIPSGFDWVDQGIAIATRKIANRIQFLEKDQGHATGVLMLRLYIGRPDPTDDPRALRACVVQTAVPDDIKRSDLSYSEPTNRRLHRNHLSTALQTVRQMLQLRNTHDEDGRRLDWLILPELAVHPKDVWSHLVPFARANKTIILAGLTYQELFEGQPLVNTALWVIPEWTNDNGMQIRIRRQGKQILAKQEQKHDVQGFRPCQWLIGYPWSESHRPVWLTGSVCYDATDLELVSDLRGKSDIFAIPAFNQDVKTFDQMALALNYHMFQLVLVANSGKYGGSNAYWPHKKRHRRRVFHLQGQPQANVAFVDIRLNEMRKFINRWNPGKGKSLWKHPPATLDNVDI